MYALSYLSRYPLIFNKLSLIIFCRHQLLYLFSLSSIGIIFMSSLFTSFQIFLQKSKYIFVCLFLFVRFSLCTRNSLLQFLYHLDIFWYLCIACQSIYNPIPRILFFGFLSESHVYTLSIFIFYNLNILSLQSNISKNFTK